MFVCLAVYLPELLPPQLLFKIEAAERATPFPLFGEMVLVILLLEIIREAGLRMPQTLGRVSRLDAAFLLVWLAAALFRGCFLVRVLRELLCRPEKQEKGVPE